MLATDPKFIAWEQQARPELLRSIQERDSYPPTDWEDDLQLMEDSSLDQAAILWGDMLAIREAMKPPKEPQMLFAQTNKIFLLHSERYKPSPNAMTPSTKKDGFAWLKRKWTKKSSLI
ncbi:hypothetical protein OEA41_003441 [Lepraria neglecta]|uniref:Uncharacterized protein n=1 Tax=Lepraria neglecta TaxID=209136 RepID=A0AAE0DIB7_9LECA|nr:hypothetical protein OEA41_003441 [Lepraria neglecta]